MKFSRDEVLDLPRSRGIGKRETGEVGIYWGVVGIRAGGARLRLAQNKGECEYELVVAV